MLSSGSPHVRLKAARLLARDAQPADLPVLRQAQQVETVSYVQTSLGRAVNRLSNLPMPVQSDPADEFEVPEQVRRQIKSQATEEVAGQLLHEIASPIGLLAVSASREIPDFEDSKTKRHLENLQRIFTAIEQLKCASAAPKPTQFDLAELLSDVVLTEVAEKPVDVSLHGPQPLVITSDQALVRLAVSNGVRNAVEAVGECLSDEPHSIVVTWGETNVDYWVAVLDRGSGIVGPSELAYEIGKTTKKGHSGFGLAIARQAVETLGGTSMLQPAAEGGALYEVRWER